MKKRLATLFIVVFGFQSLLAFEKGMLPMNSHTPIASNREKENSSPMIPIPSTLYDQALTTLRVFVEAFLVCFPILWYFGFLDGYNKGLQGGGNGGPWGGGPGGGGPGGGNAYGMWSDANIQHKRELDSTAFAKTTLTVLYLLGQMANADIDHTAGLVVRNFVQQPAIQAPSDPALPWNATLRDLVLGMDMRMSDSKLYARLLIRLVILLDAWGAQLAHDALYFTLSYFLHPSERSIHTSHDLRKYPKRLSEPAAELHKLRTEAEALGYGNVNREVLFQIQGRLIDSFHLVMKLTDLHRIFILATKGAQAQLKNYAELNALLSIHFPSFSMNSLLAPFPPLTPDALQDSLSQAVEAIGLGNQPEFELAVIRVARELRTIIPPAPQPRVYRASEAAGENKEPGAKEQSPSSVVSSSGSNSSSSSSSKHPCAAPPLFLTAEVGSVVRPNLTQRNNPDRSSSRISSVHSQSSSSSSSSSFQ